MRKIQFCLFIILISIASLKCSKVDNGDNNINPIDSVMIKTDILSENQDSVLSAGSKLNPPLDSILGADGSSLELWIDTFMPSWNDSLAGMKIKQTNLEPYNQKVQLINMILTTAHTLAEKKNNYYPSEGDGIGKPAQWGIAYSYGSSNYETRQVPPAGNTLHKSEAVMGLDCGGFIETIFKAAGVSALTDFSANGFSDALKLALPFSSYKDLQFVKKGELSPSKMLSGDIVIWNNHIGIIALNFPFMEPFVYQSNGTGEPKDKYTDGVKVRTANEDQKNNQGKARGVHPIIWSTAITKAFWPGGYTIWRIEEPKFKVQLLALSITNTGPYPPGPSCYGGPFNVYNLKFTFIDTLNLISHSLSNINIDYDFEYNGCFAKWSNESANNYFSNYPAVYSENSISVPFGCSLGGDNSNWCKAIVYFNDSTQPYRISNKIEFSIIRGYNYP